MYRWLNDYSQQFLDKDYLLPGQTVDERVNIICEGAEKILNIPGFAARFKENFQKGWYSLSTPIWTNFATDRGLPISCVTGDTLIDIKGNIKKKAKNIEVGDEVLTHKGRYKKVTNIIVTKDRKDIYLLKVFGYSDLYLTGDHLVLTNMGWVKTEDLKDHLVATNNSTEFEELSYSPIRCIEPTEKQETVYDFTVEEDHSFSAAGVILHNCFGSHISDTMSSILSTHAEVGMMCKNGGGTSAYFGELRSRGSKIKNNGESFGSVHFMRLFDSLINIVSQGSCYVQGTEVLTNKGFKLFEDVLESDKLAQVDEYNNVSFTSEFENVVNDFEGDLVVFKGLKKEDAVSIKVTPNHRMVVCKRKMKNRKRYWSNKTEIVEAQDLSMHRDNRFILGAWAGDGEGLSLQDRLRIAFQADGIKDGDNRKIRFYFSKKRKISRMMKLLSDAQIPFETYDNLDGSTLISLEYDSNLKFEKFENWIEIEKVSGTWAEQFVDELSYWDGSVNHGGSINYSSIIKSNVDIVQSIAALANKKTRTRVRKAYDNKQDLHYVTISNKSYRSGDAVNISKEYYKGKVYCAIVPEGRLIVRYNGRVMVCGNTRRGNFAAYLPTDHKDINEFLTIRKEGSPLQDILSGVCVSDEWMQSMIDGDAEKRTIWARVLESRTNTGFPYIFFTDNVNNNTVDVYKDKELKITHSNMCVTGDQRVVSDRGLLTAKELYEQGGELTLFDNKKVVKASPMQLIERNADVYKITLENGMTHTITSYHKILTSNGIKLCSELTIEDSIMIQTNKGLFGNKHLIQEAISAGKEGVFPTWIWESDEETQLTFIGALYGAHNEPMEIDFGKADKYLSELQIICRNLGIHIDSKVMHFDPSEYEKIKSIEHMGKEDVYCCKVESDEHLWVCNGIITHNCSEILLPDNEEESFVCDLSSMNILYYDEWKDTDAVKLLAYLLDAVMTDFINKAKDIPYMDKAVRFAENHRALGIGWLGWHSYLQSKMIPFESMEAKLLNVQVGKKINESAWEASRELAEIFGEPSVLKGYGRRNTTLTAIAPTKSSSFILGQASEGVEPIRSNYCIKDLQKGKFTLKNIYLEQLLESKGQNNQEVWDSILKNSGSVQHLNFLSDLEKNVFKTFIEISPKEIIIQAAQRQKYIDQGQSLNLVIDPKVPTKDLNALMIEAWKLGVKTLYYQIGVNAAQQLSRSILSCESCGA